MKKVTLLFVIILLTACATQKSTEEKRKIASVSEVKPNNLDASYSAPGFVDIRLEPEHRFIGSVSHLYDKYFKNFCIISIERNSPPLISCNSIADIIDASRSYYKINEESVITIDSSVKILRFVDKYTHQVCYQILYDDSSDLSCVTVKKMP